VNATKLDGKQKTAGLTTAILDPACTLAAVRALGEIGPDAKEAIPILKQLKTANSDELRTAVAEALNKIDK
jgi:HEAT repeat protein